MKERFFNRNSKRYENENFDFEKIKELARENGLQVQLKAEGRLLEIKSLLNIWICPVRKKMGYKDKVIKLIHDVKIGEIHPQNKFKDYQFMFESIRRHDRFKIKRKGVNIVDEVKNKYENNESLRFRMN